MPATVAWVWFLFSFRVFLSCHNNLAEIVSSLIIVKELFVFLLSLSCKRLYGLGEGTNKLRPLNACLPWKYGKLPYLASCHWWLYKIYDMKSQEWQVSLKKPKEKLWQVQAEKDLSDAFCLLWKISSVAVLCHCVIFVAVLLCMYFDTGATGW